MITKTYIEMFEQPTLEELVDNISGHCEAYLVQPISVSFIKEEGEIYPYRALVVFQEVNE